MVSVDTYIPCTIWQCNRCLCTVWIEDYKNAVGCFAIHAAVDPECKHIVVETVHGSDVCVDISCIGYCFSYSVPVTISFLDSFSCPDT